MQKSVRSHNYSVTKDQNFELSFFVHLAYVYTFKSSIRTHEIIHIISMYKNNLYYRYAQKDTTSITKIFVRSLKRLEIILLIRRLIEWLSGHLTRDHHWRIHYSLGWCCNRMLMVREHLRLKIGSRNLTHPINSHLDKFHCKVFTYL